jgi:hypothetical protein
VILSFPFSSTEPFANPWRVIRIQEIHRHKRSHATHALENSAVLIAERDNLRHASISA